MWHFIADIEDLSADGSDPGERKRLILQERKGTSAGAKSLRDKSEWKL